MNFGTSVVFGFLAYVVYPSGLLSTPLSQITIWGLFSFFAAVVFGITSASCLLFGEGDI